MNSEERKIINKTKSRFNSIRSFHGETIEKFFLTSLSIDYQKMLWCVVWDIDKEFDPLMTFYVQVKNIWELRSPEGEYGPVNIIRPELMEKGKTIIKKITNITFCNKFDIVFDEVNITKKHFRHSAGGFWEYI